MELEETAKQGRLLVVATGATLLLPAALLYSRAIADAVLSLIAVLFLAHLGSVRGSRGRNVGWGWGWLRAPWIRLTLVLWVWMVFCTLVLGTDKTIVQAFLLIRFFVFAAALETWVLADSRTRQRLWYVILVVALWIFIEAWQQYLFGVNLFGYRRWIDGALTGPFRGPVAGPMFLAVFFPAFLPLCFLLLRRDSRAQRLCGVAVPILAAATMIMIGQRMPMVLMTLGLCVSGLLFRQFRLPVVLTIVIGAIVLSLLPVVSPPTFGKLVVHFSDQMEHFWSSPYGLIFGRAATMIQAHPWMGLGWDGYRDHCMDQVYLKGVAWLPVSNPADIQGCTIHPHNYWLQIGTSAGLVGMVLFAALVVAWLWRIKGGPGSLANDRRAALLIAVFIAMWPIASATSLFTVPNAGWVFLMVGWGLAEARWSGAHLGKIERPERL
ncbi:MAG TPA: O-antigen ligase family protein, partial [Rhodopila sp.]